VGDEAALAQRIVACASDPALCERLTEGGLETACEHRLPLIADAYERALAELRSGVKPSSA
jgi:hypothetical protein